MKAIGLRNGVVGWLVLVCLLLMGTCEGHPAYARGLGEMSVTWHMVSQEELNERCAVIGSAPCSGLADWGTREIWTLPPTGVSDPDALFVIMHELGHIKDGCYHGPRWNDYIGPEKDADKCAARRNRDD